MIDLSELQRRFPHQKIKSQPAEGCGCGGTGVRHIKSLNMDRPCLCVCMSAPEPGEKEYRAELAKAVGQAARTALEDLAGAGEEAWSEDRQCVRIGNKAITAARARLEEKT